MSQSTTSPSPQTRGIDVSHYNGRVDWAKVAADNISFAFLKATDGLSMTDPTFATNWKGARAAGILTGAYHYLRVAKDPVAQADRIIAAIEAAGGMTAQDLPIVADIEDRPGAEQIGRAATIRAAHAFLERIEQKTGRRAIVYTSAGYVEEFLDGSFGDYPLWVANYGVSSPKIPNGWRTYLIWQKVAGERPDGWKIDGIRYTAQLPGVDGNVYRGTIAQLRAALCPPPKTLVYLNEKLLGEAWLNTDGSNYAPLRTLLQGLFTDPQIGRLLGFDAARRPTWNGQVLTAKTIYRPTGTGGSVQAWTQVRGFANETVFGLALDTSTSGRLILRRAQAGGQKP